jgi:hypothetical protein
MAPSITGGPKKKTRSKTHRNIDGTVYSESSGFSPGVLPSQREIVESMLYLLRPDRAGKLGRTVAEAIMLLAYDVIDHWEYCTTTLRRFRMSKTRS